MARLVIPIKSDIQLEHIFKAEEQLSKAGVIFDTSSEIDENKVITREWELDWSLKGAKIIEEKVMEER